MRNIKQNTIWCVFILYCLIIIYITLLSGIGTDYPYSRIEYIKSFNNLIPFWSFYVLFQSPVITTYSIREFAFNFMGNLLLFIPWGIMLPVLCTRFIKFKRFILFTTIVIICIESLELFFMLGVFDIEDYLLNIIGATLGFYIFKKYKKAESQKASKPKPDSKT